MTQLNGKFPIFGKDRGLTNLADTIGSPIPSGAYSFYLNNKASYASGFRELDIKSVNGALNFITTALSDLYEKGVPVFSLNMEYPFGAVVVHNGNLYISKIPKNIYSVSDKDAWNQIAITGSSEEVTDTNPIGTILTVPVNTTMNGYIDYVEGATFNEMIYPELFKALGSNQFAVNGGNNGYYSLPIGTCIYVLSGDSNIPDGFIEWDTSYGSLDAYPELYESLMDMVNKLEPSESKSQWVKALSNKSLPYFEGNFYLGMGKSGEYSTDTIKQIDLVTPPVIIDNSNTLNPMGYTRCVTEPNSYPVVSGENDSRISESNYVLTGQRAESYKATLDKRMYRINLGNASQTAPKTLHTKLLIKAVSSRTLASVSSTHKQIIKAF